MQQSHAAFLINGGFNGLHDGVIVTSGFSGSSAINGAALVEELEHVSFVRLVPTDLHGADRPDVEAVDVAAFEQVVDEGFVLRDGRDDGL